MRPNLAPRNALADALVIKLSGKMYEGGLIFAPYIASILKVQENNVKLVVTHSKYPFKKITYYLIVD